MLRNVENQQGSSFAQQPPQQGMLAQLVQRRTPRSYTTMDKYGDVKHIYAPEKANQPQPRSRSCVIAVW